MRRSSLIGHVSELLDTIRRTNRPADQLVRDFFRTRHYLGAKDRRFINESVFNILRNFKLLCTYCKVTLTAAGQSSVPAPSLAMYAAYEVKLQGESVESLLPDISGLWRVFVPAVECEAFLLALASAALPADIKSDPVKLLSVKYSFPESIVRELVHRSGLDEAEELLAALNQPAPTTIRVNTLKTTVEECRLALKSEGVESSPTVLSPVGLVLEKRVNAHSLRTFRQGWFEIQDEGSQLLSMLTESMPGSLVVDACAGGGGKTLHLAALMRNEGILISIDVEEYRLNNIRERVIRSGVSINRSYLAGQDHTSIRALEDNADVVLIDAPCSGVGTFRRNPGAKLFFGEANVDHFSRTQRSVLETYARLAKPGGRLVYATCTILRKENEEVVEWFLGEHPEFSLVNAPEILWRQGVITGAELPGGSLYLTLLSHKTSTDSFFAAVMTRTA